MTFDLKLKKYKRERERRRESNLKNNTKKCVRIYYITSNYKIQLLSCQTTEDDEYYGIDWDRPY